MARPTTRSFDTTRNRPEPAAPSAHSGMKFAPLQAESVAGPRAHAAPGEGAGAIDRRDRAGDVVDDEAGDALVDHLGHRPATAGDHRRPTGHRFDHREAEGLGELDEVQERYR